MFFFIFLGLWFTSLVMSYPKFFTFTFFAGMILQVMAWIPLTAPIAYAVGWHNPNVVTAKPISLTWNTGFYELGDTKTLVLEVTNNTGNFYGRFALRCYTPNDDFVIYDEAGIGANQQRSIRSYEVESRVVSVTECNAEQADKGKPKI